MHLKKPIAACPYCGGLNGFQTDVTFKAVRMTAWDGKDIDTEGYNLTSETNPKCSDCGKSVRSLFPSKKAESNRLRDEGYATIVKRYEAAGDNESADIIRRQWDAAKRLRNAN